MENVARIKEKCVECKSCAQSCPKHYISMVENNEGFWYPSVDEKSCIECKLCLKKCLVENTEFHRNTPQKVWAWCNKNDAAIMRSASGGVADSAAKIVLQMGGVAMGQLISMFSPIRKTAMQRLNSDSLRAKQWFYRNTLPDCRPVCFSGR